MITNQEYEPEQYWEKDFSDLKYIEQYDKPNVCYGMDINTFKSYIKNKHEKDLFEKQELSNQRWLSIENNFIRYLLSEYNVESEIKNHILELNKCPKITCHGGNSGREFKENAEDIILNKFNGNIIDFIGNLIIGNNYKEYSETLTQEVNLIFLIENILKIHIIIPMKKLECKNTYWFPETFEKAYIKLN